jgi:hypothetical protein
MMAGKIGLLRWTAIAAAILVAAPTFGQTDGWKRGPAQRNGPWSVWLEMKLVPATNANRAQTFEQKLYVAGPSYQTPRLLFSQSSTGRISSWLGPTGIVAVQPIGNEPGVFFPGREEMVVLQAPGPKGTNNWSGLNRCWFSGAALLYASRFYGGADYVLGYFLIDENSKTVAPGRVCLELTDKNSSLVQSAEVYGDNVLFVGTHVFWENNGWDNSWFPDAVKGTWRKRQLRAFDLDRKQISSGNEIPRDLLTSHQEALEKVFGGAVLQTAGTQPDGAANGSQPIRSETNRTPSTAGPSR